MDKADCEDNLYMSVDIPSENIELDQSMNVYHCPRWLLNEI